MLLRRHIYHSARPENRLARKRSHGTRTAALALLGVDDTRGGFCGLDVAVTANEVEERCGKSDDGDCANDDTGDCSSGEAGSVTVSCSCRCTAGS